MTNEGLLTVLKEAYQVYLRTGARSNQKLTVLHGAIAEDLSDRLGEEFRVKALGFEEGKESQITGRYMEKRVDISVMKNAEALGGIAIKYIMSNYSQNSNNYFEGMLGETANLRTAGKAYFQIVIMPKRLPYFKKDGMISKIETLKLHHLEKYLKLSEDNCDIFMHTPTKTLLILIDIPGVNEMNGRTKEDYVDYFLNHPFEITFCHDDYRFQDSVIFNDYESFMDKVVNYLNYLA